MRVRVAQDAVGVAATRVGMAVDAIALRGAG